jgi:hypothetical protein
MFNSAEDFDHWFGNKLNASGIISADDTYPNATMFQDEHVLIITNRLHKVHFYLAAFHSYGTSLSVVQPIGCTAMPMNPSASPQVTCVGWSSGSDSQCGGGGRNPHGQSPYPFGHRIHAPTTRRHVLFNCGNSRCIISSYTTCNARQRPSTVARVR